VTEKLAHTGHVTLLGGRQQDNRQ